MISKEEATARIYKHIAPEKIVAIYQAGMVDTSPLSDFDIVLVTHQEIQKPQLDGAELDIRGMFTKEVFAQKRALLPYAQLTLIAGIDVLAEPLPIGQRELNTLRLTALFFRSFLRNFYDPRLDTDPKRLLVHLNDFEYAAAWSETLPARVQTFLATVRTARQKTDASDAECKALRAEAIECAWELIAQLDRILVQVIPTLPNLPLPPCDSTLFVESATLARRCTESHPFASGRAHILFLPRSFACMRYPENASPLASTLSTIMELVVYRPRGFAAHSKYFFQQLLLHCIALREAKLLTLSPLYPKEPYLIDAFGFLINVFKDHLGDRFSFTLTPPPTTAVQRARWFAPRNFFTLKAAYWSGRMKRYAVVHFNRPESFLLFRKIPQQISVFEIHGFDIGIMGPAYLKDLHTAWKRWLGLPLDRLLRRRIIRKMQEPDILYVSTPDLVQPVAQWCGRTPEWLPNAIDTSLFSPDGHATKLAGAPACFLAARLHGDKKPEIAFELFQKEILPHHPDAVLHLLDTGELAAEYKKNLASDPHYVWHGYMDKPTLAGVIRGADIVFGDFSIGALSLLPMQVMAARRPIVSLDRYEVLKEYADDLAGLTRRILSDDQFRSAFIKRNARYIQEVHTAESISARHLGNLRTAGLK